MKKVDMSTYMATPSRYELRTGDGPDALPCPYGNQYQWIGYDLDEKEYVRFTKSVFKLLVSEYDS